MHLMGVATCAIPMNTQQDVIYTHKKFKKAASDAVDDGKREQQIPQSYERITHSSNNRSSNETLLLKTVNDTSHDGPYSRTSNTHYNADSTTTAVSQTTNTNYNAVSKVTAQSPFPLTSQVQAVPRNLLVPVNGHTGSDSDEGKKHVGGKYKCEYCGVGCAKPSVLEKHRRTHTNERPFSCDQCRLAFKTKSNYLKHTKSRAHALRNDNERNDSGKHVLDYLEVEWDDDDDDDSDGGSRVHSFMQNDHNEQPADLSVSTTDYRADPISDTKGEDAAQDRSKSIYKPKIHGHYIPSEEQNNIKISSHLPPGYAVQDLVHLQRNSEDFSVFPGLGSAGRAESPHNSVYAHSGIRSQSPPALVNHSHQHIDVRTSVKHEDSSTIQRNTGSPLGNSLWKGIKSPSPEQLGQHIEKIISVNQAIVETHNPLWSRRYRRQNSIGSSSNDGEGSGGSRNRRSSLTDTQIKGPKGVLSLGGTGNFPPNRERSYGGPSHHPLSVESIMGQVEAGSSYSPGSSSLPQSPHMLGHQAQNALISCSTSKPSISLHGPLPTSYSQNQTNYSALINHSLRRSLSEGPGMDVRELLKLRGIPVDDPVLARTHPQNPEGSVIKNILLANRQSPSLSGIIENSIPYEILERHAGKSSENGPYICSRCGAGFRNAESRGMHMRHGCGQNIRSVATPPERRTPDSLKSNSDNIRFLREQDVALDLQKKLDSRVEQERSSSRGSSVGEPSHRHGSEEEYRYRMDHTPRLYRSDSLPESASSPPTKRRKLSEIDIHGAESSHVFRSPSFSPKGRFFGKNDVNNSKLNNHQMFGGEVQIKEGTELKTMRIDPSKHPSPTLDIKIPPQQLGSNLNREDVSIPTSVVMTIAKSGLNSGGTMVQVDSKDNTSTCSTKTVPSLVSSSVSHTNQSGGSLIASPVTCKAGIAPAHLYNLDGTHFPFSPSLLPYAPTILLPNLGIPGISAPDLGVLPMYKQAHSHGGHSVSKQPEREAHKSSSDHQSGPAGHRNGPAGHQSGLIDQGGPTSHRSGLTGQGGPKGHRNGPKGHQSGPTGHLSGQTGLMSGPLPSAIGHLGVHPEHSHRNLGLGDKEAFRRSPNLKGPLHLATPPLYPTSLSVGEGKLANLKGLPHPATSPLYPAVLSVSEGKIPFVPGIPGPYSQAGPVRPSSGIHKNTVSNSRVSHSSISYSTATSQSPLVHSFVTHNSIAQIRDRSSGQILSPSAPHSFSSPIAYDSPSQESKSITTRIRDSPIQVCEAATVAAARNLETHLSSLSVPNALSLKQTKKDFVLNKNRNSLPPSNHDIRIHPSDSSNIENKRVEKSIINKNEASPVENYEGLSPGDIDSELSHQPKRPDSLALKPQQYVPKSSLALIGSTLASPDTPRPKKSCVQLLLNGSAYTYLGHKVSTKSFFCTIHKPQPMYVPQSTDPKLSMYSTWQNRKPTEANPFKLTPFQSLGLYKSRVSHNRSFTVAQKKDQGLITTHSSYWEFKEKQEKKKSKDCNNEKHSDSANNNDLSSIKREIDKENTQKDEDIPFIKRELEESLSEKGEDSETSESSSSKRVKIFEGGFKSNEDYTYVRGRGRGRYVCEACGIRCKKPSMLKKHIRTHTDLRPYTCSHCTFGFKTKGNLTKHLRSKAHYKRCVEIGITPVPTVVDASHVNEVALAALQGKMDPGDIDGKNDDDEDDDDDEDEDMDEDDDDEDIDVDEQLDKSYHHDPLGERFPTSYKSGSPSIRNAKNENFSFVNGGVRGVTSAGSGSSIVNGVPPGLSSGSVCSGEDGQSGRSGSNFRAGLSSGVGSSSCVPHVLPITVKTAAPTVVPGEARVAATETQSTGTAPSIITTPSSSDNITDISKREMESKRSDSLVDAPIDLSVKRQSVLNLNSSTDKNKKRTGPARPNFLSLKKSGLNDMRSPVSMLTSPGTPTTPIREHPADILSPVTESSTLLKSIYNTTSRITHGPYGEKNIAPELNDESNPMLKTYITERAVLDTTIKMQQYKNSSSDNSPDSPHNHPKNVVNESNAFIKSNVKLNASNTPFSNVNSQQINPQIIFTKNTKEKKAEVLNQDNKIVQQEKKNNEGINQQTNQQEVQQQKQQQQPAPLKQLQQQQQPKQQQQSKQQQEQQQKQQEHKQQQDQQQQHQKPQFQVNLDESKQSVREQILSQESKQQSHQQPQQEKFQQLEQEQQKQQSKQKQLQQQQEQQQRQQLQHINQIKQEVSQQINQMNIALESNSSPNITVGNMTTAGAWMTAAAAAQPANFTVMNNGGIDIKTSFLMPSGVGPPTQPRLTHEDTKPKCTICKKEFNRPSQLNLHMNIHYLERPYRCDACAVSFRTNGHLQKHKRSASHFSKVNMNMTFGTPSTENPRPFKCHDCKIAFRIHGHLAKHLRSKMHIMKLECLGKLPFGTYAEIERSGANLNEIDTTDCDNSLESLLVMATRLYEKDPNKLMAWHNDQELQQQQRVRTISNSSTNSEDYPLVDDQDDPHGCRINDDDTEGDEDDDYESNQVPHERLQSIQGGSSSQGGGSSGGFQSSTNIAQQSHHQLSSSQGSGGGSTSHISVNVPNMQHHSLHGSSHNTAHMVQHQNTTVYGSSCSENVREHPCGNCEAKFPSQSQLESHSKTHCKTSSQLTSKSS